MFCCLFIHKRFEFFAFDPFLFQESTCDPVQLVDIIRQNCLYLRIRMSMMVFTSLSICAAVSSLYVRV